jgi:tripartite-type tricarboxylate transporter receptor subunit TctC
LNHITTVNPSLYKLPYRIERDLQPVTSLAGAQYLLVVHPSVPAQTLNEFIAFAKQKPGSLNVASAGVGTPVHLASELFKKRVGVDMVHIAYKGGGPAATAVLAGEAQVIFGSVASSLPHVKAGRLKALATTGIRRSKVAPDLPTIAESGYPGFDVRSWYAMLVTAGTPAPIVNRIHGAVLKVIALPDTHEAMARQGLEPESSTPQELAARIKSEAAVWAGLIRDAGIKAE